MTFLDMIEIYNVSRGNELDNIESIFSDIVLDSRLSKSVLAGVILDRCGAMHCIYETTATFKYFSDNFFKKYQWNIEKLVDSINLEYDPLINRKLNWTETSDISQNLVTDANESEESERKNTGTQTYNDTGTQRVNDTGTQRVNDTGTQTNEYSEDKENAISAMNSSSYQPDSKTEVSGDSKRTDDLEKLRTDDLEKLRTDNLQSQRTDNLNEGYTKGKELDKNEDLTWDETDTHEEEGTIDTAYQDLIEKERKQAQFNIYNWIAEKYSNELFLLVY